MKLAKYLSIAALLLVSCALQLNAQVLQANVAGSSALWLEAGQGTYNSAAGNCSWTSKTSGVTYAQEQRPVGGFPENQENGNIWVVWTPGTTPGSPTCASPGTDSQVWTYLNLDSTLGDRCLFAVPPCNVYTTATAGTAGQNLLTGITDTVGGIPQSIINAFSGQPVTVAATDILPVDAKFATYKALAACGPLSAGTQYVGFGYGPGPIGATINSSFSTKNYHVIDFNVYGTDPITFGTVPSYTITPVGAVPVVVAVNNNNASGFGNPNITNVNRAVLGLIYGGIFVRTSDLLPQAYNAAGGAGVTALLREPLSGTYNTFELSIPNNKEIYRSQESGNCGANGTYSVTTNPLNNSRTVGAFTGVKKRVIGTGEMVQQIAANTDSIGYAFWSAANFSSSNNVTQTNMRYLTVDGVDPIQNSYSGGVIPQTAGELANVTLSHVADGSYPIWTEQRFISTSAAGLAAAQTLAGYAQSQSTTPGGAQPDFITAPNLQVFHAHYAPPSFFNFNSTNTPSDGTRVCGAGASPEDGSDTGGLVFNIQAGADYCVLKGNYGMAGSASNPSGPTSTASFGVHQ